MIIELWKFDGWGIIVKERTGLVFSNQTNGLACEHPLQEGFFLPLENYIYEKYEDSLGDFTCGEEGLLNIFGREKLPFMLDEDLKEENTEAWVHIKIMDNEDYFWKRYSGKKAILTWENSD